MPSGLLLVMPENHQLFEGSIYLGVGLAADWLPLTCSVPPALILLIQDRLSILNEFQIAPLQ